MYIWVLKSPMFGGVITTDEEVGDILFSSVKGILRHHEAGGCSANTLLSSCLVSSHGSFVSY